MHPFHTAAHTSGPGSQPSEPDGAELAYLSMPKAMRTYDPPSLPEPEEASLCAQGLRLLEQLLARLQEDGVMEPAPPLDLLALPEADRQLVTQALGEGEVSVLFATDAILRVQETRLAGIWRVQSRGELGEVVRDVHRGGGHPLASARGRLRGRGRARRAGRDAARGRADGTLHSDRAERRGSATGRRAICRRSSISPSCRIRPRIWPI